MSPLRRPSVPAPDAGFTLVEAVFALGLTLVVSAGFLLLLRHGRTSLNLQPEVSAMRLDGRAALDRIAADLTRAGSGFPVEVPLFTNLAPAGDRDPDGLDFLAAPERFADASFEPVIAFDGSVATLPHPGSRLAGDRDAPDRWAVVFNDDEMTPRWVFGRVLSVSGGGSAGATVSRALSRSTGESPGPAPGARVRLAASSVAGHQHFRGSVDGDTFAPGSGGGLMERGLQSLLGGVIEAALPAASAPVLSGLTDQVVGQVVETLTKRRAGKKGAAVGKNAEDPSGSGLFGLGQPGIVPVSRIRYWVRPGEGARRGVLLRRVNEEPPQPVAFAEDLQVRYLAGENADLPHDSPPGFVGDLRTAAHLGNHIVRAVEIAVTVRSARTGLFAAPGADGETRFLTRTYRRHIGLRVRAQGVERRAWEETMQLNALPTGIPRIGPLRFVKLPW